MDVWHAILFGAATLFSVRLLLSLMAAHKKATMSRRLAEEQLRRKLEKLEAARRERERNQDDESAARSAA